MKKDIHPQWYPQARVTCSCGNAFTVGATVAEIQVEICSACHPFFTGTMKYIDTAGRVEKFQQKQTSATGIKKLSKKEKRASKRLQEEKEDQNRPLSLKEMLQSRKTTE